MPKALSTDPSGTARAAQSQRREVLAQWRAAQMEK